MNFNIYLDEETGALLNRAAEQSGASRNALIREAVREWLRRRGKSNWPTEVLTFSGHTDIEPFESARSRLKTPSEDPFA